MYEGILHLHNFLRWVVLLMAIIVILNSLGGMSNGKAFGSGSRRNALFLLISCDIQLLAGLYLYIVGPWGIKNIQNQGMGNVMKDGVSRFFAMEHNLMMLVAIILVHVGYSSIKKDIPDAKKYKKLFWFTLVALLIILISVPWPFREGMEGRPLFPGM